ncbi:MAG: radical SAM protein [Opitutales bacterium]
MIAFGPIPSRRLGRSLGINNIPPKRCPYSCVYCQVGRTTNLGLERRAFYEPQAVLQAVLRQRDAVHEPVDYLSFVPDGEPTLDLGLGETIRLLRALDIPIAVISNASLIWRPEVREDLALADWVSLKVDTVCEDTWHRITRPNRKLNLSTILAGMLNFARGYRGTLVTETMLVEGVNDADEESRQTADFIGRLNPSKAYLSVPTRPPPESWVRSADEETINRIFQLFSDRINHVECLTGYEGNAFASTGDLQNDLLSITAVHPLREEVVRELLVRDHGEWEQVDALLRNGKLAKVEYAGQTYYIRRIRKFSPTTGSGHVDEQQEKGKP